ncbi:hypothetical protein EZY14_005420 [Kordia sp. TARA_039_SRF]|nr:hypothetical protein EZY14_005420 [Kordia sp. TARA_039_SRF]
MKKCVLSLFVLITFLACSVDDVASDLTQQAANNQTEPECVIDVTTTPDIMGTTWQRTSFVIESPIDGNNDGVYSTELEDEYNCQADPLVFGTDFRTKNPTLNNVMFQVMDDGNGNLSQLINCLIGDGLLVNYTQDGNTINYCFNGNFLFSGTLSDDNQSLTFNFPFEGFFFPDNPILQPDGSTENYQGGAVITYTLQ